MPDKDCTSLILWDRPRIEAALPALFDEWQRRKGELTGNAVYWSDAFLKTSKLGRRLRKSLQHAGMDVGALLWRFEGPIKTEWRRFRCRWDPDDAHDALRAAHAAWKQDTEYGLPAGRHFNVKYLVAGKWKRVYAAIARHHRAGISAFVRDDPVIAADWVYRGPMEISEVRSDLLTLVARWKNDPLGLPIGRPFGKTYLYIAERADLVYFVERHGIRRVLRSPRLGPVRRVWGRRVAGKNTREWRAQRSRSFRTVHRSVSSVRDVSQRAMRITTPGGP